jgi:hypothetical protein
MKITEILDESFDSNIPITVIKSSRSGAEYAAKIGGREIIFRGHHNGANYWDVDFTEMKRDGTETVSKTKSGKEMQVFSFAMNCIKKLVADFSPRSISFSSSKDDGNRSKLYRRMLSSIKLPGYSVGSPMDGTIEDYFSLVKDK